MNVALFHVPACPSLERARTRLRQALDATGLSATVRETEVSTSEAAAHVGMCGSPTILIDGRNPFAGDGEPTSLSCRLYAVDGSIDGAPSVGQLVAALQHGDRH